MALFRRLNIGVFANVDGAVKGFKRTSRAAKRMGSDVDTISKSFSRLGRSIAASAIAFISIRKVIGDVSEAFSRLDKLAKTADKLGLTASALAGLRFAAEQTGVEVSSLDTGLQRMVRRVSEAAVGTGEAQGALKELNLNARELGRLSPDEQFRRIADAMMGVTNQSDRVRIGFKLFDTEGVALINTLKGGSASLDEFQQRAEDMGLAVNDKALKSIQDANDAINAMKNSMDGLANKAAVEVSAFVTIWSRGAQEIIKSIGGIDGTDPEVREMQALLAMRPLFATRESGLTGDPFADFLRAEITNRQFLQENTEKLRAAREAANARQAELSAAFGQSNGPMDSFGLKQTEDQAKTIADVFGDLNDELDKLTQTPERLLIEKLFGANAGIEDIREAVSMMREIEEIQKNQANAASIEASHNALQNRLDMLLLTEEELLQKQLRILGASKEQVEEQLKLLTGIKAAEAEALLAKNTNDVKPSLSIPSTPRALQRGSVEARSAEIAAMNRFNAERQLLKASEKTAGNTERMVGYLDDIRRNQIQVVNG